MCFNQLGIALDGYGDGAVLLLRGTELRIYISQWSGNCRYAFDHTTHQSVENAVKKHGNSGRWVPRKVAAKPKATGRSKGAKDSKKPEEEDDNEPDGGDTPGKPQRKTRKRSRDDEDDGPSGEPASKKSKTTLAVRGRRQMRTNN